MTLLALEAGLKVPEALLEVAASLETGEHEMQTRCGGAQCYYCVQCAVQVRDLQRGVGGGAGGRGLHRPGGLRLLVRYWKPCFTVYLRKCTGNGGYFSPTTARCIFIVGDAYRYGSHLLCN